MKLSLRLSTPFAKLMLIYVFWLAAGVLSASLFEVYFFNLGLSIQDIFLTGLFWFVSAPIMIPFFKRLDVRPFMLFGILFSLFAVVLLYLFPRPETAFAFRFMISIPVFFFWVPFNTIYYEFKKENHALLSAIYYSTVPALALVLPVFGGFLAEAFGYSIIYLISIGLYVATFIFAYMFLEKREYKYDFINCLKSISGLRSLIFLEGFAASIMVAVTLDIVLLLYVDKPFGFGSFLSIATVFAIIASFVTAKISDKLKHRRSFIILVTICFGLSAIFASQAPDLSTFFLAFGIINFFKTIFFTMPFALIVDNSKSLVNTMVGREFMLGVGRTMGVVVGYIILINSNIQIVLLFHGVVLLLYVLVFENRKGKLKRI